MKDPLVIAGKSYGSRLLVGTGKYRDFAQTRAAIEASGAEIVTVAIRRTNIGQNANEPSLLDALPPSQFTYLPNTAGCYSAADAVRTLRLARELLDGHDLVKLEVLGDPHTLYPNMPETLKAAKQLVQETAMANAQFSLLANLPAALPGIGVAGVGADIVILTKNQVLLVYKLAALWGARLDDPRALLMEILPVVGGAFLWRTTARALLGLVPSFAAVAPKVAVAYLGTYVVGGLASAFSLKSRNARRSRNCAPSAPAMPSFSRRCAMTRATIAGECS